ncbi:carbohydrate ABC transporter membrane protein 1 (CUT1 family) [Hydrogenoanaerobacterium saccharovorans]|uniref:Raffinose/stachyose/melibiose transport system permease protein n=1 Tax=Hydrogenoanaerobacterium saccharovorans TaxID=474960 RepID=A0A1H8CYH0_9FIRM|nr:sugar ABC transporter permease [Hydrogenoanaerobacterium saccharovorans]RPF43347.1 carbohydrate ABC transporter membrane protein 1 (CUT1 family) [Hydrogenoanaerobacterium saccharovorans]SEM99267.1 raffinose/stachyose/melibiose transport system permease protein [Hydrogenoanaerobacterium saccharovorans]
MKANKVYSNWFLIPAVSLYTILFIIPVIIGFTYSFTNWNSMSDAVKFIGLKNYQEIFTLNSPYLYSIIITFVFTFFTIIFKGTLGLGLALLLNSNIKCKNVLRGIFFLPYALSPLIIGIVFISVLSPNGIFNEFLRLIGFDSIAKGWLTTPNTVLGATIGVESWRMIGWNMVIYLAGLQAIPKDYYEASSIDGASAWVQFIKITIPFLMPSLTITTVLNTIHGLKTFDLIFALTGGGPGSLTEVINVSVFREYSLGRYGMSTALGVVVFLITSIIALTMKNVMTGKEVK